jgi:hypothetical protein
MHEHFCRCVAFFPRNWLLTSSVRSAWDSRTELQGVLYGLCMSAVNTKVHDKTAAAAAAAAAHEHITSLLTAPRVWRTTCTGRHT